MATTDKKKTSVYIPADLLDEMREEADRHERSLSWVVAMAWKIARDRVAELPGSADLQIE